IFTVPPPPTNLTASCPSPGSTLSVGWTLPNGYTASYLRLYKVPPGANGIDWASSCDPNHDGNTADRYNPATANGYCSDGFTGSNYSFTQASPGATYYWYVH